MPWHILRVHLTLYGKMAPEWNNKMTIEATALRQSEELHIPRKEWVMDH